MIFHSKYSLLKFSVKYIILHYLVYKNIYFFNSTDFYIRIEIFSIATTISVFQILWIRNIQFITYFSYMNFNTIIQRNYLYSPTFLQRHPCWLSVVDSYLVFFQLKYLTLLSCKNTPSVPLPVHEISYNFYHVHDMLYILCTYTDLLLVITLSININLQSWELHYIFFLKEWVNSHIITSSSKKAFSVFMKVLFSIRTCYISHQIVLDTFIYILNYN